MTSTYLHTHAFIPFTREHTHTRTLVKQYHRCHFPNTASAPGTILSRYANHRQPFPTILSRYANHRQPFPTDVLRDSLSYSWFAGTETQTRRVEYLLQDHTSKPVYHKHTLGGLWKDRDSHRKILSSREGSTARAARLCDSD